MPAADLPLPVLAPQATVRCLEPFGQLLEIGKYDILRGTPLSMRPMHDNVGFQGIDLDSLLKGDLQDKVGAPPQTLEALIPLSPSCLAGARGSSALPPAGGAASLS